MPIKLRIPPKTAGATCYFKSRLGTHVYRGRVVRAVSDIALVVTEFERETASGKVAEHRGFKYPRHTSDLFNSWEAALAGPLPRGVRYDQVPEVT